MGSGHVVDGKRNVIYAEGGTIVTFGVDGLVVVQCGDITLVSTKERAPDLKGLLERIPASVREQTTAAERPSAERPTPEPATAAPRNAAPTTAEEGG